MDYLDGVDHLENALWLLGNLTGDSEKMCEHVLENVHLGECMFEMLRQRLTFEDLPEAVVELLPWLTENLAKYASILFDDQVSDL